MAFMNKAEQETAEVVKKLRCPSTIRVQASRILDLAKQNKLAHFNLDLTQMTSTADFIIDVIKNQYPDLNIPYHSRWRHFEAGGVDRISCMIKKVKNLPAGEQGKILYELVIISVFLDAGSGASWRYKEDSTGINYSRSEGLALASLSLYQEGVFSSDPKNPFRVDATRLINFQESDLQQGFQITSENPLAGSSGRVSLLNRLGTTIKEKTKYFGSQGRLGDFYDYVCTLENNNTISATDLFQAVLNGFDTIWPVRLNYNGIPLGDVWTHNALKTLEHGSEYIPFHKLSQWLTYSLIEPLEQSGIKVTHIEDLTGLPEYRNGGLLIDTGLLCLKNKQALEEAQDPSSELVVEWRALTVALLDELAKIIRDKLHKDSTSLPLAKILQGGTWEAGLRIAKQKRTEGTPPIHIISDGTIF